MNFFSNKLQPGSQRKVLDSLWDVGGGINLVMFEKMLIFWWILMEVGTSVSKPANMYDHTNHKVFYILLWRLNAFNNLGNSASQRPHRNKYLCYCSNILLGLNSLLLWNGPGWPCRSLLRVVSEFQLPLCVSLLWCWGCSSTDGDREGAP